MRVNLLAMSQKESNVVKALNEKVGKQLDPFEHARKRPTNYIGPIKTVKGVKKVVETRDEADFFEEKSIQYNQGLERIFIEILSNAKDNFWESQKNKVKMAFIKVNFSTKTGEISVENDGLPIPVIKHPYQITDHEGKKIIQEAYPAEKFFGNMNFGTNFDKDREKKKSSGLNGMGGKLANIFSTTFEVCVKDHYNGKMFSQKYSGAGKKKEKPVVKTHRGAGSSTKITFTPDYEYFGFESYEDFERIIKRHCYDAAFVFPGIRVYYNGQLIKFTSFGKIVDFYSKEKMRLAFKVDGGDECIVVPNMQALEKSTENTGSPLNVSFINGIRCDEGGVHVNAWVSLLLNKFKNLYNLKAKKKISDKKVLYPFFTFYVRSETVEEISFEHGNVKNKCVTPDPYPLLGDSDKKSFNKTVETQIQKMLKWPVVALIEAKLAGRKAGAKKVGHIFGANFQHANKAGPNYKGAVPRISFISEGVSAHKLFENLRAQTDGGADYYGGIHIRGKFSNVEKKTNGAALNGDEVTFEGDETHQDLKAFYNLRNGVDYSNPENLKTLNYDIAYAMTDADDDGIHIRGLLIIFFSQFKGLLESGFFGSFNTYNVILTPKVKKGTALYFFNHLEFQKWLTMEDRDLTKYSHRYFKGLGSYAPEDYKLHTTSEGRKTNIFVKDENAVDSLRIAFSTKTGTRKEWMTKTIKKSLKEIKLCPPTGKLNISDFVNKDLVHFFIMTLSRALPSRIDGMKQSQRQIIDTILSHPETHNKNVSLVTLEGMVKSHTGYEHASIYGVVCNMAIGYPGSNNLPLLLNQGGYANRVTNVNSQQRYLFTRATPELKAVYKDDDFPLLVRRINSGRETEYEFLLPIVPPHLINGSEGIASGWASTIYPYNPKDIINGLRQCIRKKFDVNAPDFVPWYRGFIGKIYEEEGSIFSEGVLKKLEDGSYHIKEIPIGTFNSDIHSKYLNPWVGEESSTLKKAKKKGKNTKIEEITEKKVNKASRLVDATKNVVFPETIVVPNPKGDLSKADFSFLKRRLKASNLTVVDENGMPITFKSARELLQDFYDCRIKYYPLRKAYWTKYYNRQIQISQSKIRFIKAVNSGEIEMSRPEKEVIDTLDDNEYLQVDGSYDYLLTMSIRSLTLDKAEKLENEVISLKEKRDYYKNTSSEELYEKDLDEFEEAWMSFLKKTQDVRQEIRVV